MSVFDPPELLLSAPHRIEEILVEALKGGFLSIFLGAGVSMSTSASGKLFPSWPELVKGCCDKVGLKFDDTLSKDNRYLRRTAEAVEANCASSAIKFVDVVEEVLYAGVTEYDKRSLKLELLVALGSLVMTSVRGSAAAVVNYNFDDLLEWYLAVHGFKVGIVSKMPELVPRADVIVYHPHGFLPKNSKFKPYRTKDIIFGERSYQRAMEDNAWNEIQRSVFGCNICLFVGMSGDDPHVEALFSKVHDHLKGSRILGVILLKDTPENRANEDHNKRRGVLHYYIPSHDGLPEFLLGLCRTAAGVF